MTAFQLSEMRVELFTAEGRITGTHPTRHVHIRDVLNEAQETYLDLKNVNTTFIQHPHFKPFSSLEARIDKAAIILAIPHRIKGHSEIIKRRKLVEQAGVKTEERVLVQAPPFHMSGVLKVPLRYDVKDALNRLEETFICLGEAAVHYLPHPAGSFRVEEVVVNRDYVQMICAGFKEDEAEVEKLPLLPSG